MRDDGEFHAVPVDLAVLAVTSGTGRGVDDGRAAAGQSVEKGGLAHVGASDDGDEMAHEC